MAQPTPYIPSADFSAEEASNVGGRSTVRTAALDAELGNIQDALTETQDNLALIQRDDGKLRDGLVEIYNLSATARAALQGDLNPRGDWSSPAAYAVNDLVEFSSANYLCVVAHTSGTFATDLAAGNWLLTASGSASAAAASAVAAAASTVSAQTAQANAETAETNAETAEANAETARAAAEAALAATTLASAASGAYPNSAASNVPRGLTQASVGAITAGSGGTNGTFALAWSAGNFSINPTGTFTVAGGALTAVTITGPGLYIGASPTVPTPSFAASAGLAGAAVVLTAQFLITSGQGYWVLSSDGLSLQRYTNASGAATSAVTSVHSIPTTDVTDPLHATPVSGAEYAIQDGSDNASEYIEPATGKRYMLALDANSVNGIPRSQLARVTRRTPNLTASIVHHISYGQSLSLGQTASTGIHTLAAVDSGFFDSLMFNANGTVSAGPRAQEGSGTAAQNHASFVAYEERPMTGASPSGNSETPLGNAFRMIKRLLRDEDSVLTTSYEYQLLGSAPGQSNTAIAGLVKGQVPYTNLIADVTYGLALATAAGKSYSVNAIYWSQGERDIVLNTVRLTYKTALLQLYTDLNTDIKALTGQTNDIKLICYQVSEYDQATLYPSSPPAIALAQLDAAKANSNIILATSLYAMEHLTSTNIHLTAFGYATLGAYFGLAAKRTTIDQGTWPSLYPTRLTRQGTILDAEFPDTGYPLAISNALFPTQTNAGFTAVTTGLVDNPIVSVTVIGPRRVRVVLTNALAGYLRYGFATWGGNLHDTNDADAGTARQVNLYQPCLTFEESFA